ncbi:protocatechuate 4,5-dioxygenase subunit alpha [Gammaproteobacteria bacterium]|nr:protocatechuate 4,5-dioxygenase subunit alpha [Gammaproteobacteria bacterium]
MTTLKEQFADVPGTYLFTAEHSRKGYHLNMFCMSLIKEENRKEFLADEAKYLDKYPLTDEQRRTVLERDWIGMIKAGGNIYFTIKLGATDGKSFQYVAGEMTGMGQEKYRKMMVDGGRSVEHNRSKSEQEGA